MRAMNLKIDEVQKYKEHPWSNIIKNLLSIKAPVIFIFLIPKTKCA